MKGRFRAFARDWATVLLPQPAGPVISQIWLCFAVSCFRLWLVPFAIVLEVGAGIGR